MHIRRKQVKRQANRYAPCFLALTEPPTPTKRPPEFSNPAHQRRGLHAEKPPGPFEKFAFLDALRSQADSCASVNDGFAEKLAIGRVNQRMRAKNFFQVTQRSS